MMTFQVAYKDWLGSRRGLSILLISFLSLLSLGCGNSNDEFVFTGTNNPPAGTGSLTFNFIAPTAQAVPAPSGTTSVRFDLFNGAGGTGTRVDTRTAPFQTTITLNEVSTSVRSTRITFIAANGVPLQTLLGNVSVPAASNAGVDLTGFTSAVPVFEGLAVAPAAISLPQGGTQALTVIAAFSNDFDVNVSGAGKGVTYTEDGSDHVTVSAAGVITGTNVGTADVTVSFTANGTTLTVEVPVSVTSSANGTFEITPAAVTEAPGDTTTAPLVATFTPTSGSASNVIGDVDFVSNNPDVVVNPSGTISIAASAQPGDSAVLTGTYTDGDGNEFSDVVAVTVATNVLAEIVVTPATVTLPSGGFRYDLQVTGTDNNGDPIAVDPGDYFVTSSTPSVALVAGNRVTTGAVGTSTVTVTANVDPSITATSVITTVAGTIDSVSVSEDTFDLYISQGVPIQATAELSTGQTLTNIQFSPDFDVVSGESSAAVVDGELRALEITSPLPYQAVPIAFGMTTGGATPSLATLTVREVQLTSVDILIGGLPGDGAGNYQIPAGRYAIFEVIGHWEDGSSRPLRDGEEYEFMVTNPDLAENSGGVVNGAIDAELAGAGDTSPFSVNLLDEIQGDLTDPTGNLLVVDGTPTALRVAFLNYPDDHRLLTPDGSDKYDRELDVRADFGSLVGFRISDYDALDVDTSGINGPDRAITGWPTIASSVVGSYDEVEFTYDSLTAVIEDVQVLTPDRFAIEPGGQGLDNRFFARVGTWLSFRTVVDYGDGQGAVDRSLDYAVFEEYTDFVHDVWGTINRTVGGTSFFFKRASLERSSGNDYFFRVIDAESDVLEPLGPASRTDATVEVTR